MAIFHKQAGDPPGIYRLNVWSQFKVNANFVVDTHSRAHTIGAILTMILVLSIFKYGYGLVITPFVLLYASFVTFNLGFLWEVFDGFKDGWWQVPPGTSWLKTRLCYADGFSWSDLIFDALGILFIAALPLFIIIFL